MGVDESDGVSSEHLRVARCVSSSALFDDAYYCGRVAMTATRFQAALHYVLVGEEAGLDASHDFSASIYRRLNPDLDSFHLNLLYHFETHGRGENRRYQSPGESASISLDRLDPDRRNIIIVFEDANNTNVFRLGLVLLKELRLSFNVIALLTRGGAKEHVLEGAASSVVGPFGPALLSDTTELRRFAKRLLETSKPCYVVANGLQTHVLVPPLRESGAPVVTLVHEFGDAYAPGELRSLYEVSDAVVFPSQATRDVALSAYGLLRQRRTSVVPFGLSGLNVRAPQRPAYVAELSGPYGSAKPFITGQTRAVAPFRVIGCGDLDLSSGIDLFGEFADAFSARYPEINAEFIWLVTGGLAEPTRRQTEEMMRRHYGWSQRKTFISVRSIGDDGVTVEKGESDVVLVTARVHSIPSYEAQAASLGTPVVCLGGGTLFSELLVGDPLSAWLVASRSDQTHLLDILHALASDKKKYEQASSTVRRIAREAFNSRLYASALNALASSCASCADLARQQAATLAESEYVNLGNYFKQVAEAPDDPVDAARRYLMETRNVDFTGPPVQGHHPRRPLIGFNPFIYAQERPGYTREVDGDPVASFIKNGRPPGRWTHDVIDLDVRAGQDGTSSGSTPRAAIHGHFHYADNIDEFFVSLKANRHPIDIILTTTTEDAASRLAVAARAYSGGQLSIEIRPNIGRDIGPFIDLLHTRLASYDVVCHVHGKRSIHTLGYDAEFGNAWRNFLWGHLLGPGAPVMDIILAGFGADPRLGLVFPENEQLIGWEENWDVAVALAPRLKLASLPQHIEFPAGTMFWARPKALGALIEAGFRAEDYPVEPLALDGTMLHAMERMIPLIVEAAGYRYATTYTSTISRLGKPS